MLSNLWHEFRPRLFRWAVTALPGIAALAMILLLRFTGSLEFLEGITLDSFLRLRPAEAIDERVVIVGIDEKDIQQLRTYPVPDRTIANLLKTIQQYKPSAIGLDIVRDMPVNPGHAELVTAFQSMKNLVAVEKVLPTAITPPPDLPPEQISFADVLPDKDGKVRRALLGMRRPEDPQQYTFSLPLRLAETYLKSQGIELNNGIRDSEAMRFGAIELPRVLPNDGGYVNTDDFGVQILLNYRSGQQPFRILPLREIAENSDELKRILPGRIVLIGVMATSVKDYVDTAAIPTLQAPGKIYGVEFHAHVVSHIVSAVLDSRVLLRTWSKHWETIWIVMWGMFAIVLGRMTRSPLRNLVYIAASSLVMVGIGYISILFGWWIPTAPALLGLVINGAILSAFYQYDRTLRSQIELRHQTIERTFVEIHCGPLQTLANLLRHVQDQDLEHDQLLEALKDLNYEIREIGEYLKLEALDQEETLRLGSGLMLDLKLPMRDLFYEVYSHTLQRNFPCFETLKVRAYSFDPIEEQYLNIDQKRELCQFLEEALCNAGKHASGLTRLSATGQYRERSYILSIKDNGAGIRSDWQGRGTKQCLAIARRLRGNFVRTELKEKGTLCRLTWSLSTGKRLNLTQIRYRLKTLVLNRLKPGFKKQ
ncbi:CHASE2 domain-containing protein [Leptolyngbya sp. NIES-2104]|uniref:CHASE2 domain-containing protein n=1 Tax=Leptolyngbya sp. NIES-2104 TaxID=1552121 RepID=UPI0006EC95C5|nr:CHASE2 domain-containing protein [Leptolyngbya sp. NIES-2104]GAP94268.1 adenylate cyclase [Leptolyngbya sp. NIES-2104]